MKTLIRLAFVLLIIGSNVFAQSEEITDYKKWRVEVEPGPFVLKGYAASVAYNLDPHFMIGLYSAASNVPEFAKSGFDGVGDTTNIRMPFEIALHFRYKIPAIKKWETNPVVGLITGYEYFDIEQPNMAKLRISTFLITSYLGMEIYLYKKMVYVNPQMRTVVYYGTKLSDDTRPERLNAYVLPQLSLGVRF